MKKQALKAMFKILKDTKDVGKLPPKVAFKLFDSLVLPILEYGSDIWFCNEEIPEIERVHTKFIKIILGVHKNASNLAIYGETGRYPLIVRQKVKALKYWAKVVSQPESSIIKKVYNTLLNLSNGGLKNWVSNIELMLVKAGFQDIWTKQECPKIDVNCFKKAVQDKYAYVWLKETQKVNSKLRTYCTFKQTFNLEAYLLEVTDYKLRKCLTKFRISNHCLAIEKGRHESIPIEARTCPHCTNVVEDEFHVLMQCPSYDLGRSRLFKIREEQNLVNNFISIMSCKKSCFYLAKYLYQMYKTRQLLISEDRPID